MIIKLIIAGLIISGQGGEALAAKKYSATDLQQLAGPIALYPDTLLKDMLPASTFPDQITDAALLIQDKSDADLIKSQSWDTSVKIIATYPGVLKMMYGKLIWTTQLGEAFLNQSDELLDAIQTLRAKAQTVGNLKSDDKQEVSKEKTSSGDTVIKIAPTNPEVIYVPQNTTTIVYTEPAKPDYATPLVAFGLGMALGSAMDDDDDDVNVYYGGYGGNMWGHGSYNDWADTRRARNEDYHDEVMDRQNARQDRRADKQDFRQDYVKDNPGSINRDNINKSKDSHSAQLDKARASMNNRDLSSARASSRPSSAYSNMNNGSFSSRASSRGATSRSASNYGGSYGSRSGSSFGGGSFSGGGSRSGGGFSRGGGGGRRR